MYILYNVQIRRLTACTEMLYNAVKSKNKFETDNGAW